MHAHARCTRFHMRALCFGGSTALRSPRCLAAASRAVWCSALPYDLRAVWCSALPYDSRAVRWRVVGAGMVVAVVVGMVVVVVAGMAVGVVVGVAGDPRVTSRDNRVKIWFI